METSKTTKIIFLSVANSEILHTFGGWVPICSRGQAKHNKQRSEFNSVDPISYDSLSLASCDVCGESIFQQHGKAITMDGREEGEQMSRKEEGPYLNDV